MPRIFSKQNFVAVATAQGLELRWVSTSPEPEAFALDLPEGTKVASGTNVGGLILTPQKGLMFVSVTAKASGPTSVILLKKGLKLLPSEALAL